MFIVFSLIVAGIILLFQSNVKDPWHLLYIRSISGFVLAFLSPACLSLLARIAQGSHSSKQADGWQRSHTYPCFRGIPCGRRCISCQNWLYNSLLRVRLDPYYHRYTCHLRCERKAALSANREAIPAILDPHGHAC